MSLEARQKINKLLGSIGMATLENAGGFLDQFAFLVQDHEHLRQLLLKCEPDQRKVMYESIRTRLRFRPKPLDVYIAEGKDLADREQLPVMGPAGQLQEYKPGEIKSAEFALAEQTAKRSLALVCHKCKFEQQYFGFGKETRVDVVIKARKDGWRYNPEKDHETCPQCMSPEIQ